MRTKWSTALAFASALMCIALLPSFGVAQSSFPSRTITIVVTVNPGGITDVIARAIARELSGRLKQRVIVENRTGITHAIGASSVLRSPPDGHTLLAVEGAGLVVDLGGHLPYDPTKDFSYISGLVRAHHVLVANPTLPANDVAELVALARQKPGTINHGTSGLGSSGHMNMELLMQMADIRLVPVHYRGAAPALNDVIAGHIQTMFSNLATALVQAQANRVKILGIGNTKRHPQAPDIPTIAERGVANYAADTWFGLFGPQGMSPALVQQLNAEVQEIMLEPSFRSTVIDHAFYEPVVGSSEDFARLVREEVRKWENVAKKIVSSKAK